MGQPAEPHLDAQDHRPGVADELAAFRRDGYVVLPRVLDDQQLHAIRTALAPHLAEGKTGRNRFEGHRTQRVYALIAKSQVFADLAEHPRVLRLVDQLLAPGYLLSANLAINLHPGEQEQPWHCDDSFSGLPRPRPAHAISTIWAIDEFTSENGSTEVVPGSHRWGDERPGADDQRLTPVLMPAGSVVVFSGLLWHRGGANRSSSTRLCITPQYCAPWQRQQENYMLSIPRDIARRLSPRVQQLLGYSIHAPHMGHVNGMHPLRVLADDYVPTGNVAAEFWGDDRPSSSRPSPSDVAPG